MSTGRSPDAVTCTNASTGFVDAIAALVKLPLESVLCVSSKFEFMQSVPDLQISTVPPLTALCTGIMLMMLFASSSTVPLTVIVATVGDGAVLPRHEKSLLLGGASLKIFASGDAA